MRVVDVGIRQWERLWFGDGSARNLAAARIVVGLHALWILLSRDFAGLSSLPQVFFTGVDTAVRWRYLILPNLAALDQALAWITVACLTAVVLGVTTRVSCLVAAVLLYHLAPLETVIWTASAYARGFEVTILALVVLALAPCADAWSLSRPRRAQAPWEYHWPLVLIQLFVAQIYLFSGWSKLVHVGFDWASPDNISNMLRVLNTIDRSAKFDFGLWVAQYPLACAMIGIGGYVMDFGFILAVFWRRSRWVIIPGAMLFHISIMLVGNVFFLNIPQLLVFIDWEKTARHLPRKAPLPRALQPASLGD